MGGGSIPTGTTKASSSTFTKAAGAPASDAAAATARPAGGWQHTGGRNLAHVQVGEAVEGRITNILHERVWIDIGAAKDASFWTKSGNFRVGDHVSGLSVRSVNLEKGHVVLQSPDDASVATTSEGS